MDISRVTYELERQVSQPYTILTQETAEFLMKFLKMDAEITPGDEVAWVDDEGLMSQHNKFIVTEIDTDESIIGGIDLNGSVHFHDEPDAMMHWKKTGRHFDILDYLSDCDEGAI